MRWNKALGGCIRIFKSLLVDLAVQSMEASSVSDFIHVRISLREPLSLLVDARLQHTPFISHVLLVLYIPHKPRFLMLHPTTSRFLNLDVLASRRYHALDKLHFHKHLIAQIHCALLLPIKHKPPPS